MTPLTVDAFSSIVGRGHVSGAVHDYVSDITENPAGTADLVVRPGTSEEVAAVMATASERHLPVTPVVSGYNVAGIAIPTSGGIVLDLTRLDRILDVDEDSMYVLLEPGVTFGQLKHHLDGHHPDLVYSYPFAPPFTSVLANALLDGLNNLSLRHGAMGNWLNGVEAVLADGTVVRTGAGAVSDRWFGRAPLPDLTGLFVSTQGTTGVVTKAASQLQPAPVARHRLFAFAFDIESAYSVMRALARSGSVDDVGLMTWPAAKMLFGATRDMTRADDEPLAFLFVDLTGSTRAELALRVEMTHDILRGNGIDQWFPVEDLIRIVPRYEKLARLPTTLDFLLDFPGGGLTWVGAYGPGATWTAGADKGMQVLEANGFPPFVVARPMAGGHYFVLRFVACFDKGDDAQVARVRTTMGQLADVVLDHGYVPYKASSDAARRILSRAHPGFDELFARIRTALDPDGRMNPGRWSAKQ